MKSLTEISNSLGNDKGTLNCPNPLHFTTIYENYFDVVSVAGLVVAVRV